MNQIMMYVMNDPGFVKIVTDIIDFGKILKANDVKF